MDSKTVTVNQKLLVNKVFTQLLLLSLFYFCSPLTHGETIVPDGLIETNTIWTPSGSPYLIQGTVSIEDGVTLNITAGTTIKFDSRSELNIAGTLHAQGATSNPIIFVSNDISSRNKVKLNSAAINSVISYATFIGVEIDSDASITIEHSVIRENYTGIKLSGTTNDSIIRYNRIEQNTNTGIDIYESTPTIHNNIISDNSSSGIYLHCSPKSQYCTRPTPIIRFNTIDGNKGKGIYFDDYTINSILENNIITNNDTGIYRGNDIVRNYNNVWGNLTDYTSADPAPNDISSDPDYTDHISQVGFNNSDYHLQANSPSKTASTTGGEIGAYGNGGSPPKSLAVYASVPTTSGEIRRNERWSGTIELTDSVTLIRPYQLVIEAGTIVKFPSNARLITSGRLLT